MYFDAFLWQTFTPSAKSARDAVQRTQIAFADTWHGNKKMIFLLSSLLALVVAQSDATPLRLDQYTAVRSLLIGIGCFPPRCPTFDLSAACPRLEDRDVLNCTNGAVTGIDLITGLTGSVDGPALGVLTGLTFLRLFGHRLTSVPTQIGRLSALTRLILAASSLDGTVPSEVGNLSNLLFLNLNNSRLTGTLPARQADTAHWVSTLR